MTPTARMFCGDCVDVMKTLDAASVDSIVTDPPAGIGFMQKTWDSDKGGRDQWIAWMQSVAAECLRVLKPGGHALVWALPRTSHWTATAWENAGFEVRDRVAHVFGTGFPKSLDVSKVIDKMGGASVTWFGPWLRSWRDANGITQKQIALLFPSKTGGLTGCVANWELGLNMPTTEQFNLIRDAFGLPFDSIEAVEREVIGQQTHSRFAFAPGQQNLARSAAVLDITAPATNTARQWQGWGTALKPAVEDWWLLRKPLAKGHTVAANVLAFGTGAINVDACRIPAEDKTPAPVGQYGRSTFGPNANSGMRDGRSDDFGRWPANLLHDGSPEALSVFPQSAGQLCKVGPEHGPKASINPYGDYGPRQDSPPRLDTGSAARFFWSPKASRFDRNDGCQVLPETPFFGWGTFPSARTVRSANNHHPTVKATALMRYLCRLITPPGGTLLDPFMGSGSTLKAAEIEGFSSIGIDIDPAYVEIARRRFASDMPLFRTEAA